MSKLEEKVAELEAIVYALSEEVTIIKERNQRVEADKSWETSWLRIILISAVTYTVCSMLFFAIQIEHFMLNALIPTTGYALSTLSLQKIKARWHKRRSFL